MNPLKSFSKGDSKKKERPSILPIIDSASSGGAPEQPPSFDSGTSGGKSDMNASNTGTYGRKKGASTLRRTSLALGSKISLPTTAELAPTAMDEPMPSKEVVEKLLEDLMVNLGFEDQQKTPLRALPLEMKWKMIQSNKQRSDLEKKKENQGDETSKPEFFLSKMKAKNITPKQLLGLRISLKTQPIKWVISFINQGGLQELLSLMDELGKRQNRKSADLESIHEVIRCLKALMNNKHGIKAVLSHEQALDLIVWGLDSPSLPDKALVLEMLILMCYVDRPHGHLKVLKALDHFRDFKKEDSKFRTIVNNVGANCINAEEKDVLDFLVTSMVFINAVIRATDDLEFRMQLRNEFFSLEFGHIFEKLKLIKTDFTQKQVELFEGEMHDDFEEYLDSVDQLKEDFQDVQEIFKKIQTANGQVSTRPFLGTMQHLLLLRVPADTRKHYFTLLSTIAEQMLFDGKGIDPDFRGRYKVNIERILASFVDEKKMKVATDDLAEAKGKSEAANKENQKFDSEWADKMDAAKAAFESEIAVIRATIPGGGFDLVNLTEEDAKKIFGKIGEDNLMMKKALLDLKNSKDTNTFLQLFEGFDLESNTTIELPGVPDAAGGPPPPPGAAPPPPPPPPPGMGGPPPPPPPPGMGGPPPPPPPPGMGGPPPPPPPGGGPPPPPGFPGAAAPAAPRFIAQSKMKQFHWDKLPPTSLANTIWEKTKIDEAFYKKMLQWKEFEEMFGAKEGVVLKDAKVAEKKPDLISVVDPKKAYNCSLMLGLLKMTNAEVKKAILSVDKDNQLSDNTIIQFQNYIPTPDEVNALKPFKDDPSKLAAADQFMLTISEIPRLEQRLASISFKRSFKEKVAEILPHVDAVQKASKALKSSKAFHKILEIILLLGNYMNGTGRSGGALGFKLAAINKLVDTKSANNKMTLLHFIADTIENKFPEVLSFLEDLADVEAASKVSYPTMQAEVNEIRQGVKKIDTELQNYQKALGPDDNFKPLFEPFLAEAKVEFEDLEKKFKRMEEAYQASLQFFAEDPKLPPEEFFAMLLKFLELFKQARKDNADRAEQQLKELKKQQAAEEREERKKNRGIRNIGLDNIDSTGDEEKAVLDDMLQSLKSGEAYENKEKKEKKKRRKKTDSDDEEEADAEAMLKQLQSS